MQQQENNRKSIDQLKQMNTQLMAQLATASQLVSSVLGTVDRRTSAPPASHPEAKPFKDWIPQVEPYSGEAKRAPEAFLAQFRLYARQNSVPDTERARQLIGKLTGPAQLWYTLTFANDPTTATEAQIALGLRKAFGQEYAGVRALRAMFHVTAQPTQSGAQRLLALDQREEQARQLRVPLDAGPAETRFSRVLALFLDEELNPFLSELTADPRCSEEALRQLEEAGDRANTVRPPSLATASPSREALFTFRAQLAEAALRRLHARPPGTSRARLARAEGTEAPAPASPAPPPLSATPPAEPVASSAGTSNTLLATCCQLAADYKKQSAGTGFTGPRTTSGRTRTRRPGRNTRRSLNAAAMPAGPGEALAGGGGGASISPGGATAQGKGGEPPTALTGWTHLGRRLDLPHLPRGRLAPALPEASPQEALGALRLTLAADQATTRSKPWHTPCRPSCRPSRSGSATTHHSSPSSPGPSGPPPAPVR